MGNNSIRCNLNKDDIVADIRMTLAADYNHKKGIVVVEGADDIEFLNGKLSNNVDVYESFSGKKGVQEIVALFSEKRVVGICDKDYDEPDPQVNIIYYDYSCLEMMLVSNMEVFGSFLNNFYYGADSVETVFLKIFKNLKWLSIFRKLNSNNSWGVKFKGISIATACEGAELTISIEKLLQQLDNSNRGLISNHREYLLNVSCVHRQEFDITTYLNITQGHDFIFYFQQLAQASSPIRRSVSRDTLFSGLCCAFREHDFHSTNFYQSLKRYYEDCGIMLVT